MENIKITLLHDHYDQDHLDSVVAEMRTLGAPVIRVYDCGFDGIYQAIEGSHRLRACEILGINPVLVELDPNTMISDLDDLDVDTNIDDTISSLGDCDNYHIEIMDGEII